MLILKCEIIDFIFACKITNVKLVREIEYFMKGFDILICRTDRGDRVGLRVA